MMNPLLQLITLHEEGIQYLYNFVPNNFKERDRDIFTQHFVCGDRDFIILFCMWRQRLYYSILYVETGTLLFYFVCGDSDFIILFCSLGGSISRNSGTLKCWNEVHQHCSVSNQTSCTPFMNMHWPHQGACRYGL